MKLMKKYRLRYNSVTLEVFENPFTEYNEGGVTELLISSSVNTDILTFESDSLTDVENFIKNNELIVYTDEMQSM